MHVKYAPSGAGLPASVLPPNERVACLYQTLLRTMIVIRTGGTDSNYGPNFARLTAVKKQFDPLNLFRLNANIKPV